MSITKETVEDRIEILEDGTIQVRTATIIKEDGVELSRSCHRHVVCPTEDEAVKAVQSNKVKAIINAIQTPAVVSAYIAKKASE